MPILTTKKSNMTASLTLINCSLRLESEAPWLVPWWSGWSLQILTKISWLIQKPTGWYEYKYKIHCTLIMCVHKGSHEWSRDGCVGVRAYRPAWVSEPTGTTEAQHRPPWGQLSGFCASLSLLSKSPPLAGFAHHFQSIQPRILSSCIWIPATLHCISCFKL